MDNVNKIYERTRPDGNTDYIVNYGLVLYNDKVINLSNLIVPLWDQTIFSLPEDKNRFAVVNSYYDVNQGKFVFDTVLKSDRYTQYYISNAIPNLIPIAQFILQQSLSGFVVTSYNQYSKMASFANTDDFIQGEQGLQGLEGLTGSIGATGIVGFTGYVGDPGITGYHGPTGVGLPGYKGLEGATGVYKDLDLLFYAKFKTDDDVLQDYSIYERDFGWGASGAGVTGIYFLPGSVTTTGIEFLPYQATSRDLQDGVVDNCHAVDYKGGWSSYSRERYLDFWGYTGMIQAWVRVNVEPLVNFTWAVDRFDPRKIIFEDQTLFSPISWEWTFGNIATSISKNPTIIFGSAGSYVVKLKATNIIGSSERTKIVTITI